MRKARASATMSAPCIGGLEYIGRTIRLSWESTRDASSLSEHTTETVPTRSPVVVVRARVGAVVVVRAGIVSRRSPQQQAATCHRTARNSWRGTARERASAPRPRRGGSTPSPPPRHQRRNPVVTAAWAGCALAAGMLLLAWSELESFYWSGGRTWYAQSISTWCPAARMASEICRH